MEIRCNKILLVKVLLFLVILLVSGLTGFGCAGTGAIPKGWSGGVVVDDTLFLGSMEGKLVAINVLSHTRLWEVPLETSEQAAGGFGCAPASTAVAIYGSPAVAEELVYVAAITVKFMPSVLVRMNRGGYILVRAIFSLLWVGLLSPRASSISVVLMGRSMPWMLPRVIRNGSFKPETKFGQHRQLMVTPYL